MGIILSLCNKKYTNKEYYNINDDEYVQNAEKLILKFIKIQNNDKLSTSIKNNQLYDIYYEYDMLICKLNTDYNKNIINMELGLLSNKRKIIEHISELKIKYLSDKLMQTL
jgi:hypothetical protein